MPKDKFNADDIALLLIDHQDGTMRAVQSIALDQLKHNTMILAKVARICGWPVVLTSSAEDQMQGPLFKELQAELPDAFAARIKRQGIINAMDDPAYVTAVRATGRRQMLVAGVTNDVCTVFPALDLVEQGYRVMVAADAGGSPTELGDRLALDRMTRAGVEVVGTGQAVSELARDWSTAQGQQILQVVMSSASG